jgi:hypothetical protein
MTLVCSPTVDCSTQGVQNRPGSKVLVAIERGHNQLSGAASNKSAGNTIRKLRYFILGRDNDSAVLFLRNIESRTALTYPQVRKPMIPQ